MEIWLTYLAAILMAGATAFAFPSTQAVYNAVRYATEALTGAGIFLFIPVSFITFASGVASLRKDKLGKKMAAVNIIWAVVTSLVLSLLAALAVRFSALTFPVTASAGGECVSLFSSYSSSLDFTGAVSLINDIFLPLVLLALITGMALTPSSDIIRPAYTVFNSLSEVMYRIQRCVTYFGSLYVYLAATDFFISLYREKTAFVSPSFFLKAAGASLIMLLVVLPLLYALFTGFKKNPYRIVAKSFPSIVFAFVSGNIFVSALQNEAVNRCSLGVQKRIVSTTTPLGIIITRGGTCFVSTMTVLTLLTTLGAEISLPALFLIVFTVAGLSLISSMSAGMETAFISIALLRLLNINAYGAEAAVISITPFLNGLAAMLDITLISMASNIVAVRTKTDITIPVRDAF